MKKTFLASLLLFAAAATFTSCAKDETTDPATTAQTTISATVEESTRTALDGAAVKWVAGDKIMVANATATAEYTLTTGEGTTSGIFLGTDLGAGAKFALYPYSATATCDRGTFSFEMPAIQNNGNVTFGNGANPMIAQSDANGVLNFKNVCGAIRLQLKGTQQVSKIVVSTALPSTEKLSGKATVALNADGLPELTLDEAAATNRVTLNCNNVQLNTTTATSFYVVVPAATYAKELQFMIYDETGTHIYSLSTTQPLTINRSRVAKMPVRTVTKINFPDPKFRAALAAAPYNLKLTTDLTDIDVNNGDNKTIFTSQKEISVKNSRIASLKGIEYFTGLNTLHCFCNELTSLDVSKNKALTKLNCHANQLTDLNVTENKALIDLNCDDNQLKSLNVINNTALTMLACSFNQLENLDVTKNTALTVLYCFVNQLPSLDVSKNTKLSMLECQLNKLEYLDLYENKELVRLHCDNNKLEVLDLYENTQIKNIFCQQNQLVSLNIRMLTSLVESRDFGCGLQLARGATAPNYSRLRLYMTRAQFNTRDLGDENGLNKEYNVNVQRLPDK
ncbi:MAG: hypothetical protein RR258_07285 [Alistipes sp.]